jgi:NADH:ubiquinone oxidoreductase subunit
MKDLFVFTADADALAAIRAVLSRPRAIGIRPIASVVDRHYGRDPGMIKDGPELIRELVSKTEFQKVILIWDYHGSGESKPPAQSRDEIRRRLRQVTWEDRSEAVVIVPELEEWLWHDQAALAGRLHTSVTDLQQHIQNFADKQNVAPETCRGEFPKELFEHCLYRVYRRKPLQEDFERIAATADLAAWQTSATFAGLAEILRGWFPPINRPTKQGR